MIHRGTVGSMERVVAALLESYRGRLPLWLARSSSACCPSSPRTTPQPGSRRRCAPPASRRVDTDGSLGARIRASRQRRDALIAVIGPTETAGGTVQITDPATRSNRRLARSDLITAVRRAHASRAPQVSWPTPD